MTGVSALLLGFGLGFRHASDADHLVVITTLLQRERGRNDALRLALLWGCGHSAAFVAVGLLIVAADVQVPARFEPTVDLAVALMLVGFGVRHLLWSTRCDGVATGDATPHNLRPIAVGVVHGLAGSAGIALLATASIPSPIIASLYLGLFAAGSVAGMVTLTLLLARPIAWTTGSTGPLRRGAVLAAALGSIALGLQIGSEALAAWA